MLLKRVYLGQRYGYLMYILASILFKYGRENENVEMHIIYFDLACCGGWNRSRRQGELHLEYVAPLHRPILFKIPPGRNTIRNEHERQKFNNRGAPEVTLNK